MQWIINVVQIYTLSCLYAGCLLSHAQINIQYSEIYNLNDIIHKDWQNFKKIVYEMFHCNLQLIIRHDNQKCLPNSCPCCFYKNWLIHTATRFFAMRFYGDGWNDLRLEIKRALRFPKKTSEHVFLNWSQDTMLYECYRRLHTLRAPIFLLYKCVCYILNTDASNAIKILQSIFFFRRYSYSIRSSE